MSLTAMAMGAGWATSTAGGGALLGIDCMPG
jgi:hypothetical protein